MKPVILTLFFVGCAFSAAISDADLPNICLQAGGRIYFPHPTDNTKFIQCGDGARMFIITCPKGEMYDKDQTKCVSMQVNPSSVTNPCTQENLAMGNLFFPYPSDKTKFIECNNLGQPVVLSCPSRLVYDANRQSCALPSGTIVNGGSVATNAPMTGTNTGTSTNTGVVIGSGVTNNPCTTQAANFGNLFFPHPDPTKFIQCDLVGDAYVMQCPAALVWSQKTSNCQSPFGGMTGTSGTALIG